VGERAAAGAKERWAGTTEAERAEAMGQVGRKRFERSLFMQQAAAKRVNPGRKQSPDRRPCGTMTRARAEKRGHKCTAS
jgi:hypothetical protein